MKDVSKPLAPSPLSLSMIKTDSNKDIQLTPRVITQTPRNKLGPLVTKQELKELEDEMNKRNKKEKEEEEYIIYII